MSNKLAEYFATIHDGDIHSITYAIPAHELKDNQIELTKEEYYLLKSIHGANENVVALANEMIRNITKKVNGDEPKFLVTQKVRRGHD